MSTLSKNLESFVAALEPAARELGSLQLRWISSVPSSSAISDLDKSTSYKVNNTNASFSAPPAHVCRNASLAHDISLGANNEEWYLHLTDVRE